MPTPCEDLATKAELQELRDQLNELLGEKEDGTKEVLFAKDKDKVLVAGGGLLTLLGMAKVTAPKAVVDILTEGAPTGTTWQKMASMNTGIKAKFGNGTIKTLTGIDAVANTAGAAAAGTTVGAGVTATASGATLVLGGLAVLAAGVTLNTATVNVLDSRIEAESSATQASLNAHQQTMLNLYTKNKGDIDAINLQIEANNQIAAQTRNNIESIQLDLHQQNQEIGTFNGKLNAAQQQINQLLTENAQHIQKINELSSDLATTKADLTNQVNTVTAQLQEALKIIEAQKSQILKLEERLALSEARMTAVETWISEHETESAQLQADFEELRAELDLIKDLNPGLITEKPTEQEERFDKVTYYENAAQTYERLFQDHNIASENRKQWSSIVTMELNSEIAERETRYALQARNHGFNPAATTTAATQTGLLELTKTLGDPRLAPSPIPTEITREDVINGPDTFRERLTNFLERINPNVNTEQVEDLKTDFQDRLDTGFQLAIGTILLNLDNLSDKVSEPNIARGVQTGICQSLNGGGCPVTPGNPNPTQGLGGMQNKLSDLLNAGTFAESAAILAKVTKIDATVHHATWGLQKAHEFANTAWKATHLDKVMSALSVVLALHNAAMLSRNLGQTLGDLTSQALSTIGIKDSEGSPLDINGAIGQQVNSMLTNILGAETYQGIKETWNKSSRILSSASQIVWTVRSIADSAREITEWTAENTGKIGNALRRFRVVGQNAYGWMPERMNSTNKWLARVERARQGVDSLDDAASSFSSVLGEVNNIQQEYQELQEQKTKFKDNVKDLTPNVRDENIPVKDLMTDEKAASKAPNSMPDVFRGEGETS